MATDDNAVSDPKNDDASEEKSKLSAKQEQSNAASASELSDTGAEIKDSQTKKLSEELKKIQEKLTQAEENATKHWDALLRAKAEHDNTRKRLERDVENAHKFALEKFVQDLLPVIDSLEMGISAANEVARGDQFP